MARLHFIGGEKGGVGKSVVARILAQYFIDRQIPFLGFDTSMLLGYQDFCAPPASTAGAKVTAGGWITTVLADKGTFGLTAKADATGTSSSGNLTYQDHGVLDRTVKSTAVNSVTVTGNCAQILGTATVNGASGYTFRLDVEDNGEPGKGNDRFRIRLDGPTTYDSNSFAPNGSLLSAGNIQVHK